MLRREEMGPVSLEQNESKFNVIVILHTQETESPTPACIQSRTIIGPTAKRHLDGASLAGR